MTKLDLWISSQLNLAPNEMEFYSEHQVAAFYENVKILPISDYHEEGDDNLFLIGLKDAAFGDNRVLSFFLMDQSKFSRLTDTKRLALAWAMQYPQKKKETGRNTAAKLGNYAESVASFEVWCGYNKEKAIKTAIEHSIGLDDGSAQWLTEFESRRVQVYRSLKKGGQYHERYLRTKEAYQQELMKIEQSR